MSRTRNAKLNRVYRDLGMPQRPSSSPSLSSSDDSSDNHPSSPAILDGQVEPDVVPVGVEVQIDVAQSGLPDRDVKLTVRPREDGKAAGVAAALEDVKARVAASREHGKAGVAAALEDGKAGVAVAPPRRTRLSGKQPVAKRCHKRGRLQREKRTPMQNLNRALRRKLVGRSTETSNRKPRPSARSLP